MNKKKIDYLKNMSLNMRKNILKMAFNAGNLGAHIAPGLSIVDICAVLYGEILNINPKNPMWDDRDRFLLSKGHGALGYYTALAEVGFFTLEELETFEMPESFLTGQPSMCLEKGIEISSGSLGIGLSIGAGIALAGKLLEKKYKTYVLIGDGECNEGSIWEAVMFASHFKLKNLIVIVDLNNMQSDGFCKDIINMENYEKKWKSFGWKTKTVDGHNISELLRVFKKQDDINVQPKVFFASTIKGKGISFMENNNMWHHNQLTKNQYEVAIQELNK